MAVLEGIFLWKLRAEGTPKLFKIVLKKNVNNSRMIGYFIKIS